VPRRVTQESRFNHSFRRGGAENPRLFVFLRLFSDFLAGMRYILACACYGIASTEESRRAEKNDKTGESDCKVLTHNIRLCVFGALLTHLRR
jgi:hypothetical protein